MENETMSIFRFWTSHLGRIELELTPKQAASVSHSGDNVVSAVALVRNARVKKQLDKYTPELIKSVLSDIHDWDDDGWKKEIESGQVTLEELDRIRLVWIAGNDITDEIHEEKS